MKVSFELFKKTLTNGVGKPDRRFIEQYGNVSFEDAYLVYEEESKKRFLMYEKIEEFELFLISQGVTETQSNVSESRYYSYKGMKYRFSSHIYPTGSMTSDNCIDFAADPHLIHEIKF